MPLAGTYVVIGRDAVQVHMLSRDQTQLLREQLRLSGDKLEHMQHAYRLAFHMPEVSEIIPAWYADCLEVNALHYDGPHMVAVKGICAALLLGHAIGPDAANRPPSDSTGGQRVPLKQGPKLKGPKPMGGIFAPAAPGAA